MGKELDWENMQDEIYRYFNTCSDEDFIYYYNKIFSTQVFLVKIEDGD